MKKRLLSLFLTAAMTISLLFSSLPPSANAAKASAISRANALYTLGLFRGTGTNPDGSPVFSLDREATRVEAVVMLVRILGKENEAKRGTWTIPFEDVEDWAKPYVGYAYSNGLSRGVSETTFGSESLISVSEFITLILRALGYSSAEDFEWDKAYLFSDSIGLTDGSYNAESSFTRGDAAVISYSSLSQKLKDSDKTLLASLYERGAVSSKAVSDAGLSSLIGSSGDNSADVPPLDDGGASGLKKEQIYEKCSPAVFHIDMYDSKGKRFGTGSGFFIDSSGTAVTNYHMIYGAYSEKITMTDGKVYDVLGVYDTDVNGDLAIIKVNCASTPYLEMGDSDSLKTGQTVYAIGNPKGLDSSFSNGLVSHLSRERNGAPFIQISVPISHGSSGGALIDGEGRVVGVTSAGIDNEQNLNYAAPINSIKKLSRASYTPLSSGYTKKVIGYAQNPSIPDFGAYSGVMPAGFASRKNGFTYIYSKADADDMVPNVKSAYFTTMRGQGFNLLCSEAPAGSKYSQNGVFYSKGNLRVLFKTITLKAGDYLVVDVFELAGAYPKKEAFYPDCNNIPDLGSYFGLSPTETSVSDSNSKRYVYSLSEAVGAETAAVTLYCNLLDGYGYKFSRDFDGVLAGRKFSGYVFSKEKTSIFVGKMSEDNNYSLVVQIFLANVEIGYEKHPGVPDFGACFGVSAYETDSSSGWDYYYYVGKLIQKYDAFPLETYHSILLKWGFEVMDEYSDKNYTFYTNGNYIVATKKTFSQYPAIGVRRIK